MVNEFLEEYSKTLHDAVLTVDKDQLTAASEALRRAYLFNKNVFVCGNGGSAAISQHFLCDHSKGICHDTGMSPKVTSLSDNVPLITAIGNDFSFEEIYSYQLEMKGIPGDLLVVISSSGNSPNIIKALEVAKEKKIQTLAMVGFSGGRAAELADIVLHVQEDNYGIVEDAHQMLMHVLAQFIRVTNLNKNIDDIKL